MSVPNCRSSAPVPATSLTAQVSGNTVTLSWEVDTPPGAPVTFKEVWLRHLTEAGEQAPNRRLGQRLDTDRHGAPRRVPNSARARDPVRQDLQQSHHVQRAVVPAHASGLRPTAMMNDEPASSGDPS